MIPEQLVSYIKRGKAYLRPISELSRYSNYEVEAICDYCGSVFLDKYSELNRKRDRNELDKDACRLCRGKKVREINLHKYGEPSVLCLVETKEKIINTNLDVYGHERPTQSSVVKAKIKKTCLEKYGVDNVNKIPEVQQKRMEKTNEKYSVDYYCQTEEFKNKAKEKFLEIYGTVHPMKNSEFYKEIQERLVLNYGVTNISQLEDIKDKKRRTCFEHWGSTSYLSSEEYKSECIKKYGYDSPLKQPYVREKILISLYNNGSCPTSKAQRWIYDYLNNNGFQVKLNYPVSRANLDVALFYMGKKIDIEFDGRYWHQDKEKDARRDFFMMNNTWNVIRFVGDSVPPTEEQLLEAIEQSINNERRLIINLE